jgi:DNA mismatch repair protein MutL
VAPTIHPLATDLVALIAAGEVIDSWAAVVRELVENAIDAEATHLRLTLQPELWRLQLADNGRGMAIADLEICAQAHSTSKIQQLSDLWRLSSLGFRGEALHSLAQVADLTLASRPVDDLGWQVKFNHQGQPEQVDPAAIAPGTIVTLEDLFGTIPQRRAGLPSLNQQLKAIQTIIYHFALCHPSLTWQVDYSDRPWLYLSPGQTAQDILPQMLKNTNFHDFYHVKDILMPDKSLEPASFSLILGLPDRCHRRRPDWIKVAINGRVVRSPSIEQVLLTGFARTLPRDRYPVCFLHLTLPPDQVDWNRNPAKTEIYLKNSDHWLEQLAQVCDRALQMTDRALPTTFQNRRLTTLLKTAESSPNYAIEGENEPQFAALPLKAVGQVNNTYIVAEHPAGLWLVEQHIAHERVIFEQIQAQWQIIELDSPLLLDRLTLRQLEQLQQIGLELDRFGEDCWAVRSLPQSLLGRPDALEALQELSLGGDLQTAQVAVACRTAIRNGTTLTHEQMQQLLGDWQRTRNPHTCPHGRPIYLALEESSLSRFFRRHWVIGKSHGI